MIKILLDTSSDMPLELREKYNIKWLPFGISFGEEFFLDQVNITPKEFYDKIKETGIIPKTSQVTKEQFKEGIEELLVEEDDQVLIITLASTLSGTYDAAVQAMEEIGKDKVRVFDSTLATIMITDLAITAGDMINNGANIDEIMEALDKKASERNAVFMIETLEYLRKGGRIGHAQSVIGGLLNIKVLLLYKNAGIEPFKKVKGKKQAIRELIDYAVKNRNKNNKILVVHADNKDLAEEVILKLEEALGEKVDIVTEMGAVIGTHAGPGTVAVSC